MIGTRPLGRLALFALVMMCLATISCGGAGSAGTPQQDFATIAEHFAGQFSGRTQINANQRLTFTFTGSTTGTVSNVTVSVETVTPLPDGVIAPFEARDYDDGDYAGTFDKTNGAFTLFGFLVPGSDPNAGIFGDQIATQITGQAGGPFTSTTPGTFTLTIGGAAFTGSLIRGTFEN